MLDEKIIEYGPLYGVPSAMLEDAWKPAYKLLEKAMDRLGLGKYYWEEDLRHFVENKDMQLWVAVVDGKLEAAFLTQIVIFPRRKVFDILIVGGDKLGDWVAPSWGTFKDYAKSHECDGIRGFGREGWTRVLEERGIEYSAIWDLDL